MAINFPATAGQPTDGSFTYSAAGVAYFWDGDSWVAEGGNVSPQTDLTAFSVTTNPAGSADLSYNNTTGVFSYTPPEPAAFSVTTNAAGSAALSVDSATGVFSYTPPDLSSYLTSYTVTATDLNAISINALSDVDTNTAAPSPGQFLSYDGTNWVPINGGGGTYSDTDVDLHLNQSNPTAGYVLSWDGTDYAWVTQPTSSTSLSGLSDVTLASEMQYQLLAYDGSGWVNTYPSIQHLIDVQSDTDPQEGELLQWVDGASRYEYRSPANILGDAADGQGAPSDAQVLSWDQTNTDYKWVAQPPVGLTKIEDDQDGKLGSNLDLNGYIIGGTGQVQVSGYIMSLTNTFLDKHGRLRNTPPKTVTSDYTLTADDSGLVIVMTKPNGIVTVSQTVTSPTIFGQIFNIINHTSTDITIAADTGLTLYNTADGLSGNKTAAQRSSTTIVFIDTAIAYCSGTGLS